MRKKLSIILCSVLVLYCGCAQSKAVNTPEAPYESLGSLELKVSKNHSVLKYLTFGAMRERSFGSMTRELNKALDKTARTQYGADAVTNITYWPEASSAIPGEYLYGRGEMIRFKKFASEVKAGEAGQGTVNPEQAR